MIKIKFQVLLLSLAGIVFSFSLSRQNVVLTDSITKDIINNHYNSALQTIATLPEDLRGDPLFSVLKLATLGMRNVDFETIVDSASFLACYKESEDVIEKYRKAHRQPDSSYVAMLSGMAKAIHATFYIRQKKYFAAMQNGFSALDQMKAAQEIDTLNHDVDFFLGLYEFIRSELRAKLWWVLFWYPGDRNEGIRRVRVCSETALITAGAAKISLCDMYLQNNQTEEAFKVISSLKKQYPQSRFVLWAEVKYYEAQKNFLKAAEIYGTLSQLYESDSLGEYNSFTTAAKKAALLYKSGDINGTKVLCNNMLDNKSINRYQAIRREIKKLTERCDGSEN